jgi:hypothetical protein
MADIYKTNFVKELDALCAHPLHPLHRSEREREREREREKKRERERKI